MDIYADNILDHYRNPRHKVPIADANAERAEENLTCGDKLTVQLKIANDRIAQIGWSGVGCAISQAGMSLLSEHLEGMPTEAVLKLGKHEVLNLLGVPIGPRRLKCALMSLHAVKNALREVSGKQPQSWLDTVEIADE